MAQGTNATLRSATLGFETTLWKAADALRGHMDAAEYKHVVLGLIFLKYISDSFGKRYEALQAEEEDGADPEDKDEYTAVGVFWVPPDARWAKIQENARQETIGVTIDEAMGAIERENLTLRDVLPKGYARPTLPKEPLGRLIDLITNIETQPQRQLALVLATEPEQPAVPSPGQQDILGRTYEYFLGQFASAEGKKGGEFYTPASVVRVLVEMLAPYKGRVYDPACGSGGMFVQSEKFILAHGGKIGDIAIYGQESNPTTWKLAKMNLAIRGIDANLGRKNADSFREDLHPDLRADYILANPPFNTSDWGGDLLKGDKRWAYGPPPAGNANLAWVQHFVHHLAPNGVAGFVLANGTLSSTAIAEGTIRQALVDADLVDCIVAMPGQLFYSTQIPVSIWILARNKRNGIGREGIPLRDRRGTTLFINAEQLGFMEDRTHRDFRPEEIAKLSETYHNWRGDGDRFEDEPGFARSADLETIRAHRYALVPGRYVGFHRTSDDQWSKQFLIDELEEAAERIFSVSHASKSALAILGELLRD